MTEAEPVVPVDTDDARSNVEIAQSILDYESATIKTKRERDDLNDKIATLRSEQATALAKLKTRIGNDLISIGGKVMRVGRNGLEEVKVHA